MKNGWSLTHKYAYFMYIFNFIQNVQYSVKVSAEILSAVLFYIICLICANRQ